MTNDFWDNPEELACGAVFGLTPLLLSGWWTVLSVVACCLLWRAGGCIEKSLRRWCVPAVLAAVCWLGSHNPWSLAMMGMAAPLYMGYGIPDATDKGSALGRFFMRVFKDDPDAAEIMTRATIGFLCVLFFIPMCPINLMILPMALLLIAFPVVCKII